MIMGLWTYWAVIILMMIGLYIVIARNNLVKKVMGLSIFQVGVIMFYISIAKVKDGSAPIYPEGFTNTTFSNPLPHTLMLTAIVVGIATTALALALVVRINEAYGTVEEDEILAIDDEDDHSRAEVEA